MSLTAIEQLRRQRKLTALSNVVLLNGQAAAFSQAHLEAKIAERIDKEFRNQTTEESEIITNIKKENLHFVERKIKQQNDGEFFIQIGANLREKDVHLFHKFADKNLDTMELLVMGDTLIRAGVKSITAYLPYIPYQRQDTKNEGRVPISAKLFFNLLSASMGSRLKRIVTFDLHARQAQGHFEGPVDELSSIPEFAAYYRDFFKPNFRNDNSEVIVFSPDAGGAKRAEYLATLLNTQYETLDKKRTGHGNAETRFHLGLDVEGKKVIIVDDMIDSGSSLVGELETKKVGPVQYLKQRGADVYICATHHVLSIKNSISAEQRLENAAVPVLFTDSLPEKHLHYYKENRLWMQVISLDHALAKAFYCNQVGESISQFLKSREERLLAQNLDFVVQQSHNGLYEVE